jgi:hypothetical protein
MNNKTKNIRAKLKINNSDAKHSQHDLNDLLKDKELVGEQHTNYFTFESIYLFI